jgi:CheY-like chemotaxis protein
MVPQSLQPARTTRILVVEDEVLTRALIVEELRLAGFSVIEADRADDAPTYIKAGEQVDLLRTALAYPGESDVLVVTKQEMIIAVAKMKTRAISPALPLRQSSATWPLPALCRPAVPVPSPSRR